MAGGKTQNSLSKLEDSLQIMPTNMRVFSLTLRSLYNEHDVGSSSAETVKFKEMRDATRLDAQVYIKAVLPASKALVRSLKEFFEYYIELDYSEWTEALDDIIEDVKSFKDCCNAVIKLHKDVMMPLKKRKDEAVILIKSFESLTKEYEKQVEDLQGWAIIKAGLGIGLLFVPVVKWIACPLLMRGAHNDMVSSVAKKSQLDINQHATVLVRDELIPALDHFIGGLEAAASFFQVVHEELETFQSKGEKLMESKKNTHYKMIKKKANEIKGYCQDFFAMIPGVESDFDAIPTEPSDKNYVDEWLNEKREEIEQKYPGRSFRTMVKMMTSEGRIKLIS